MKEKRSLLATAAFTPGFVTIDEAIKAGEEFFAKTSGKKGVYGQDFHVTTNKHGRYHFDDGPVPKCFR